jgi:hypothetical protein
VTLREALEDAAEGSVDATARAVGWLVGTLSEAAPCGNAAPIVTPGDIELAESDGHYTPSELRAMCGVWLRAADDAERIEE